MFVTYERIFKYVENYLDVFSHLINHVEDNSMMPCLNVSLVKQHLKESKLLKNIYTSDGSNNRNRG